MPSQASTEKNSATGVIPAAPWRIVAVTVQPNHRLAITFRDGRTGVVDCSQAAMPGDHGIYTPLADPDFFARVAIELGALTWPNGADLDPAWLHEALVREKLWSVPFKS